MYGVDLPHCGEFAKQLLATRRLVERGVRFVQIQHGGGGAGAYTPWLRSYRSYSAATPVAAVAATNRPARTSVIATRRRSRCIGPFAGRRTGCLLIVSSSFPRRTRGSIRGYRPSKWKERGGIHIMVPSLYINIRRADGRYS